MARHVQQSLFDIPTFNVVKPLKAAMNKAAKKFGKSRSQIVDGMNDLAEQYGVKLTINGEILTQDTLEKWLNPKETGRQIPLRSLPIFCAVVKDPSPLNVLAKPLGYRIIGPEDQDLLIWARNKQIARKANRQNRQIEAQWDL